MSGVGGSLRRRNPLEDRGHWSQAAICLLKWAVGTPRSRRTRFDASVRLAHLPKLRAAGLDGLYYLATDSNGAEQRVLNRLWKCQRAAWDQFDDCARTTGITCLAFKGAALVRRFFGNNALGAMADVDLLVKRDQAMRCIPVLYDLGYIPGYLDTNAGRLTYRDVVDIASHETEHYELVPYCRLEALDLRDDELAAAIRIDHQALRVIDDRAFAVIELDIHHQVATDIPTDQFFDRAVVLKNSASLSDADHLWFGLSRLYAEVALHGKVSLRDFAYIGPLLTAGEIAWDVVLNAASEYELRPGLFYFLRFLGQLTNGAVPNGVLKELNPTSGARARDWGSQISKLLDLVEPPLAFVK
jgi:hypothetical protein